MKLKFALSVLSLSTILLSASPVLASEEDTFAGNVSTETDSNGTEKNIITSNGKQIENYNSTDSNTKKNNSSITINANFIEDTHSSEKTTVLSVNGFVPSGRKFIYPKNNTWEASMLWPSSYKATIINESIDSPVKITNSTPSNTIRNKEVSSSISYGFGGGISIQGKSAGGSLNGNVAFTKNISYQQPDYETIQTKGTNYEVAWKTNFTETTDGYSRDSWHGIYGNQMFMKSRQYNSRENNFTADYQLSALITGGFSPNYGVVLKAPKNVKKSLIKVALGRESETYTLKWTGFSWTGVNRLDQSNSDWSSNVLFVYELDWENHTLKSIS
ncbi:enterococcus pore-forming toxin Epx (plasmid) [Enterococcus faecalis]